jgi:transposase
MPWSEADRAKYDVIRERYSSDLSDAEFGLIFPLLPTRKRRGRRPTCAREILNALFYLIRSGCPWRFLPKDFPPFTTVQNRFYARRDSGLWPQIVGVLVMGAREAEGREAAPTAVVADSQSVKTTEAGGPRGFDAAKKSRVASGTSPSIRLACPSNARSPPPTCRIATRWRPSCARRGARARS